MDLRSFLKLLRQNIAAIMFFTFLGTAIAVLFSLNVNKAVRLEKTYFIPSKNTNQSQEAEYWSQEKARNFTDTAIGILSSPEFSKDVLKTQGNISVRKIAPQLIKITGAAANYDDAVRILEESLGGFNEKMTYLSKESPPIELRPISESSQKSLSSPSKAVIVAFGALSGMTLALFVIGLKRYLDL